MTTASRKEYLYELLPWHENDTLEGAEKEAVRARCWPATSNRTGRRASCACCTARSPTNRSWRTNMAMNLRRLYARLDPPVPRRPRWFVPVSMHAAALLMVAGGFGLFKAGERAERFHTLTSPSRRMRSRYLPTASCFASMSLPESMRCNSRSLPGWPA